MQPQELMKMYEAYKLKTDRENYTRAYFTWWSILPHVKKGFQLKTIFNPIKLAKENVQDIDEMRAEKEYYAQMAKEVGKSG